MSHWGQWRRRLDPWHEATRWAWLRLSKSERLSVAEAATDGGVFVRVELPFPKNARRDPHNYVGTNVKSIVDALTTQVETKKGPITWEGAWPDDTPEFVTVIEPELVVGTDVARVHITSRGGS
jgi:hypothetical protein